jgi:hypothetical protein
MGGMTPTFFILKSAQWGPLAKLQIKMCTFLRESRVSSVAHTLKKQNIFIAHTTQMIHRNEKSSLFKH